MAYIVIQQTRRGWQTNLTDTATVWDRRTWPSASACAAWTCAAIQHDRHDLVSMADYRALCRAARVERGAVAEAWAVAS